MACVVFYWFPLFFMVFATRHQFVLRSVDPAFHATEHRQRRCIRSTAKQLCHARSRGRCSFVQQRQGFQTHDSSVLDVVRFVHQYATAHLRDNGAGGGVLFLLVCHLCRRGVRRRVAIAVKRAKRKR